MVWSRWEGMPALEAAPGTGIRHRALGSGQLFSTQVSLLPPPCDELTTSDPLRSATRVSPPGTIVTFSPDRMYGRRSTWRGSIRPSMKQGARDSASVGCAM